MPASYDRLALWDADAQHEAIIAYQRSCKTLLKAPKSQRLKGVLPLKAGHFHPSCTEAVSLPANLSVLEAREFFTYHFDPYLATSQSKRHGLFTGYYEIDLEGSHKPAGEYAHPLYVLPKDSELRRLSRREIHRGGLDGKGLELVYLNDHIAGFFLHIQGSGRVKLPDGKIVRVGYAGQNGHPYFAIGKELLARKVATKAQMTADFIREWLAANPDEALEVMETNPSYVYFRIIEGEEGPLGAQGVPLTPERSIAIDARFHSYGLPIWLETSKPAVASGEDPRYHRLFIAQDTGGAIRGPVRGDIFYGNGRRAELYAGATKQKGSFYLLIPSTLPKGQLKPFFAEP